VTDAAEKSVTLIDCGYVQGRGHLVGDVAMLTRSFHRAMLGQEEFLAGRWYSSLASAHRAARRHAEERTMYWLRLSDGSIHKGWEDKAGNL